MNTKSTSAPLERNKAPDMTLLIKGESYDDHEVFEIIVLSEKLNMRGYTVGPKIVINKSRKAYIQDFLDQLSRISPGNPAASRDLAGIGMELFNILFPDKLKELYWSHIRSRVKNIQIVSYENWLPWQLVKPVQGTREDKFLGEKYEISRWSTGIQNQTPATRFSPFNIIVANDISSCSLPYAHKELEHVQKTLQNLGLELRITPAQSKDFYHVLEAGGFAILHVTTHANYDPSTESCQIELEDTFIPDSAINGKHTGFAKECSFVFINACGIARQSGYGLSGAGGFVRRLLEPGVKGVLCTSWDVSDEKAMKFSKKFYDLLLAGKPIGESVQKARLHIKNDYDPSWLSYTFFGDPFAVLQKPSESG